jgi:ribosomal protein L29
MENLPVPTSPILPSEAWKLLGTALGSYGGLKLIAFIYGKYMDRRMNLDKLLHEESGGINAWMQKKYEIQEIEIKELEERLQTKQSELFDIRVKSALCDNELIAVRAELKRYSEDNSRLLLELQRLRDLTEGRQRKTSN